MKRPNPLPPDRMTALERRAEPCALLALGLLRLRMREVVLNGTTEIRGSFGEISGAHVSEATALWLQTMAVPTAGDSVELQEHFRDAGGYFAAEQMSFWGCKIG